jgi:rhodanese-related sulfurtransferase
MLSLLFSILLILLSYSTFLCIDLFRPAVVIATEKSEAMPNSGSTPYRISVESVRHKLKEKQDILLVDVRNKKEFEAFSIPGSLNIPLFAIKTKSFLKPKWLVLVNEGYDYRKLEQTCEDLRESGFNVWVLQGGLYYWKEKGGRLKGDPFAQKELNKMPPSVFFTERDDETWMVIDVSSPKKHESNTLIPQAISLPFLGNETQFVSTLNKVTAARKNNQNLSLLVYNEKGENYTTIESILENAGLNVFFMKGGIRGYEDFLKRKDLIKEAKHNEKATIENCSTCP